MGAVQEDLRNLQVATCTRKVECGAPELDRVTAGTPSSNSLAVKFRKPHLAETKSGVG
jgi:hypothetical protein